MKKIKALSLCCLIFSLTILASAEEFAAFWSADQRNLIQQALDDNNVGLLKVIVDQRLTANEQALNRLNAEKKYHTRESWGAGSWNNSTDGQFYRDVEQKRRSQAASWQARVNCGEELDRLTDLVTEQADDTLDQVAEEIGWLMTFGQIDTSSERLTQQHAEKARECERYGDMYDRDREAFECASCELPSGCTNAQIRTASSSNKCTFGQFQDVECREDEFLDCVHQKASRNKRALDREQARLRALSDKLLSADGLDDLAKSELALAAGIPFDRETPIYCEEQTTSITPWETVRGQAATLYPTQERQQ